jgi:biopolymer transport protein ExbD
MLDLAYVLLVIFILMTTAGVQGLKMNLPKPSNKPSTEKHEVKIIKVQPTGTVTINGAGVSMAQLENELNTAKAKDPKFNVMISGEANAPYGGIVSVIDLVNKLAIENVGLATGKIGT